MIQKLPFWRSFQEQIQNLSFLRLISIIQIRSNRQSRGVNMYFLLRHQCNTRPTALRSCKLLMETFMNFNLVSIFKRIEISFRNNFATSAYRIDVGFTINRERTKIEIELNFFFPLSGLLVCKWRGSKVMKP